jgi:hypothetical protein
MSNYDSAASIRRYAEGYVERGLAVIPVPEGRKRPVISSWQKLRLRPEELGDYFNGRPQNIGVLLGEPSDWVVDVDLDTPETVALGPIYLIPTIKSGRVSAPHSHWWYRSEGARTERWRDTNGITLAELRSTGCQTVVEPSTHPEGDRYLWHHETDSAGGRSRITEAKAEQLAQACRSLATAALIARHLPPVGGRHDFALALAGFLLKDDRMGEEPTGRRAGTSSGSCATPPATSLSAQKWSAVVASKKCHQVCRASSRAGGAGRKTRPASKLTIPRMREIAQ